MKKKVKLIFIPKQVEKLEKGMILKNKDDNNLVLITEYYVSIARNLSAKYKPVVQPIIISETDEIKEGDKYYDTNLNRIIKCFITNINKDTCFKVIATTKSIGIFQSETISYSDIRDIYKYELVIMQQILDNNGECNIELNDDKSIKYIDKKVIISLTE